MLEYLMYCVWNIFFWVFRFFGGNINQFGFLEREVYDYCDVNYCCKIVSERCIVCCLVVLVDWFDIFKDVDNYCYVNDDEDNNGCDFN